MTYRTCRFTPCMVIDLSVLSSPHVYDSASKGRLRVKLVCRILISIGLEKAAGWRMTNRMSRGWMRGEYVYDRSATRGMSSALQKDPSCESLWVDCDITLKCRLSTFWKDEARLRAKGG